MVVVRKIVVIGNLRDDGPGLRTRPWETRASRARQRPRERGIMTGRDRFMPTGYAAPVRPPNEFPPGVTVP
ncbi:hypothetical protein Lfu02_37100 [Longispora fulva]|nr:hypothetical protein Lfu02_37100 [Longispora fulva]